MDVLIGEDIDRGEDVWVDTDWLRTHLHMIGATGAGKSTAIMTLLRPLMLRPGQEQAAIFVIDPLGNLSRDILALMAHPLWSNDSVRERLVYIEPAREEVVVPFNPLIHTTDGDRYYRVSRAMTIVLRAFQAQDLSQQPRLARWLFNAFLSAATIGIPIAACEYLLVPGSPEHEAILRRMPSSYRHEWLDILKSSSQALQTLDSTRNRLQPFFKSPMLRRMFGVESSRFDVDRFIRERRIVILNLGSYGRLAERDGDTIGALALNEIIETARTLATNFGRELVDPTYVIMDEFQRFVGPDIGEAIPTVRQMGLRCVLAHQSFSQLERGDVDLTKMIWQARSRLMFANAEEDADRVAHELAKWTFDPKVVKDERYTKRQLITGYQKEWLENYSETSTSSRTDVSSHSSGENQSTSWHDESDGFGHGRGENNSTSRGETSAYSDGQSKGRSQVNVPIHETFDELASREFQSFAEFEIEWGQRIRRLKTGQAFWQQAEAEVIRKLQVDHVPIEQTPETRRRVDELIARNFESEFFISAEQADREAEECRRKLLSDEPMVFEAEFRERHEAVQDDIVDPPSTGTDGDTPFAL